MRRLKIQIIPGMYDILEQEQRYFQKVYKIVENIANFYDFQKIDTPIVEFAEVFLKGGLSNEELENQFCIFKTKEKEVVVLRPEGTISLARAYINHGMHTLIQPIKLWYFGPFFRVGKIQDERLVQFHQFGFVVFGEKGPVRDAQIIQIAFKILKELNFKDLVIEINSIGDSECRPYYKKILANYFRSRRLILCPDCRARIKENPLKILTCKEEKCQRVKAGAPQIVDHLCRECHNHFKEVLEFLDELELPYNLNPYLVGRTNYYTKTVFKIFENTKEGKSLDSLIDGGRYDNIVKLLKGKEVPACGMVGEIEKIVALMKKRKIKVSKVSEPKIFLTQLGFLAKRKSLKLFEEFRKNKIKVSESFGKDSLKTQLGLANRLGIRYILIFGQKEALEETITLRDTQTGKQELIPLKKLIKEIKKKLSK